MSLLSICQSVARQVAVDVPTVVIGSSETNTQALLSSCLWSARRIFKAHNWLALTKEYTFATLPGVTEYALPSDYHHLVTDSAWNRSDFDRVRGAVSPQEWQYIKSGLVSPAETVTRFRIKPVSAVQKFVIDFEIGAQNLVFEYVSRNWARTSGFAEQDSWAADTDEPILDADLVELGTLARMLRRLGMDYGEEMKEFEDELALAAARDGGGARTISTIPAENDTLPMGNIPDGGWLQ